FFVCGARVPSRENRDRPARSGSRATGNLYTVLQQGKTKNMIHSHEFEVGGKTLSLESGRVAKQAGGAVLLGMGETVVFASARMSESARSLAVLSPVCDYEERKDGVGKIPGGFIKRGGRPSEKAVLTSRRMARPLRPLYPEGLRHDVQVIALP